MEVYGASRATVKGSGHARGKCYVNGRDEFVQIITIYLLSKFIPAPDIMPEFTYTLN